MGIARIASFLTVLAAGLLVHCGASGQVITYFHNDQSGTPLLATDGSGNVVWRENYRPYGEKLLNQAAAADNRLGFAGQSFDSSTGLSYMGARTTTPCSDASWVSIRRSFVRTMSMRSIDTPTRRTTPIDTLIGMATVRLTSSSWPTTSENSESPYIRGKDAWAPSPTSPSALSAS